MKRENIEMSSPFVIEILINFLADTFDNIKDGSWYWGQFAHIQRYILRYVMGVHGKP